MSDSLAAMLRNAERQAFLDDPVALERILEDLRQSGVNLEEVIVNI